MAGSPFLPKSLNAIAVKMAKWHTNMKGQERREGNVITKEEGLSVLELRGSSLTKVGPVRLRRQVEIRMWLIFLWFRREHRS